MGAVTTGLHGFYDYQSNGTLRGRLWMSKTDPQQIQSVYMLALDGADTTKINTTRRVGYARSSDGGASWQSTREIQPGFRLGFPSIDVKADGTPYIATHGDPDGQGVRTLVYTGSASALTFSRTGMFERLSILGSEGEDGAGVIWPSLIINPKDATKQVVVATLSQATGADTEPVHVSVSNVGSNGPWSVVGEELINTSSGGRNVLATSAGGKVGLAYFHFDTSTVNNKAGIYLTESTNGGNSWGAPVRVIDNMLLDNGDTANAGVSFDLLYNGEEPQVVADGSTLAVDHGPSVLADESVFFWNAAKGVHRLAITDTSKGLGIVGRPDNGADPRVIDQPGMGFIAYPTISLGDDGRHIVAVFMAAAEYTDIEGNTISVISEDGFQYFRLWAVGSPDGGATWGQPRIIQDFAGDGTDSASIEYPLAAATGSVKDNNFTLSLTYQARRKPGMYAFIVTDIDGATAGNQPADRGPITETFQYFQRTTLDPTFFGEPASVGNEHGSDANFRFVESFPNPASGTYTVSYALPTSGSVSLKIYNMLGTEVMAPVNGENGYNGTYTRHLDLSGLASGQYRMLLEQNGRSISQPLTIVR